MTHPRNTLTAWEKSAPACLLGCVEGAADWAEAIHLARCELDLIEEGQDSVAHYTPREKRLILEWVKRWRFMAT